MNINELKPYFERIDEKFTSVIEALELSYNTLRADISSLESKTEFRTASITS